MMNFFAMLKLFLQLVPLIVDAVKTVEAALPVSGAGAQKLAMVRAMMEAAAKSASDVTVSFERIWQMAEPLITQLVAGLNAAGEFKRSSQ